MTHFFLPKYPGSIQSYRIFHRTRNVPTGGADSIGFQSCPRLINHSRLSTKQARYVVIFNSFLPFPQVNASGIASHLPAAVDHLDQRAQIELGSTKSAIHHGDIHRFLCFRVENVAINVNQLLCFHCASGRVLGWSQIPHFCTVILGNTDPLSQLVMWDDFYVSATQILLE